MTNAFLERVFARYLLPAAVYNMALEAYGRRYAHYFNAHPHLGARVTQLLGTVHDEEILVDALHIRNSGALDVVLSRPQISRRLVEVVLESFLLCEPDRERLRHMARTGLGAHVACYTDPQFTSGKAPDETWPRTEPNYGFITQTVDDARARDLFKDVTFDNLSWPYTATTLNIGELSQVLANEMGDGTTVESLDAWRYFLAMMDSDCEESVVDIVEAAQSLSSDFLQTA